MGIQEQFYDLVNGRKTGIPATMLRGGLRLLEIPYRSVISARNFLYDRRIISTHRFPLPVISVGNLTLGGTGKSPLVAWLCRLFLEQNVRPGLISRGYGKGANTENDEFKEMSYRFPTIPHFQNPNRAEAIQKLLQSERVDMIILDDAFQHRQVERNVDIVLLDATAPFGFGHVFPRGTLREPLGSLRRADVALLTRSNLIEEEERLKIRQQVLAIHPNIIWGETVHAPTSLVSLESLGDEPIESIRGQSVLAFCGIGNPAAFRKTLEQCGVRVAKLIPFPDHYRYTAEDARELVRTAKALGTDSILCTMKDLVKLNCSDFSGFPLRAVSIEIRFTTGESAVRQKVGGLRHCAILHSRLRPRSFL
ncbi:MAG: tetraacyldisaccharide 4'-kinase [Planctomycetaceae bacterium]|jgi:tetraacyldisaccharide 4'-kinase|nr:tetraacyldisaccharide 4'-kinase [Planctomycetaceae bacterium]